MKQDIISGVTLLIFSRRRHRIDIYGRLMIYEIYLN